MKITATIICVFVSFVFYAFSGLYENARIGGTQLNGNGCVCHNLYESPLVHVWIDGPDTLAAGQTGIYRMYMYGGPAEAGGYNVAGRFGVMGLLDTLSVWDYREPGELTQAFPLPFPTTQDTIFWEFAYTASDSSSTDTLYSCGLSLVWDAVPDSNDKWAFGPKFPLTITEGNTPVELASFTLTQTKNGNTLEWLTASEINNSGFEIQRATSEQNFELNNYSTIGFVKGNGTTTNPNSYSFFDDAHGNFSYRLKQIDLDGKYTYSKVITVESASTVDAFELDQNFPNPFNPTTKILVNMSMKTQASLNIYNANGEFIKNLFDGILEEGRHEFVFNAENLASGIYYYSLESSGKRITKKMLLLK
ncbi:MAG: T9SS type A sorting domain-containing protein [Ignavibacteriales bacterium]|nr:MAG: T9SS type A sorting domain-containing protein [Ignavibacteriales bacterium]